MAAPRPIPSLRVRQQEPSTPTPAPPTKVREVQPLSDEEFHFAWRGLADEGRLSVHKLQVFMQEVCGYPLSTVQAKDLMDYMDANGDGRVGMEDFRNFMSVPCLAKTDAKNFMWTPKAKYIEEHLGPQHEEEVHAPVAADSFTQSALGMTFPLASVKEITSSAAPSKRPSLEQAPEAVPEAKTMPVPPRDRPFHSRGGRRPLQPKVDKKRTSEPPAMTAALEKEKEKERPRPPRIEAKTLAKIEQSLLKYERESWEHFLKFEDEFKRELFEEFAGEGGSHLTTQDYHKMLTRWFPMAKWCAPGPLRPADSLATLESALRTRMRLPSDADDASASASAASGTGEVDMTDAKMDYALWLDIIEGTYSSGTTRA